MISVRSAQDRGHANHGWLDTWHTFSFGDYYDPAFQGFSCLRVINEDKVSEGAGFPMHPHRDMEILTYVLSGSIEHEDSMGNKKRIEEGEFQIMSAGTGVRHSEYNPSRDRNLHFYQIWIIPNQKGLPPRYEQRYLKKPQGAQLVLSPDEREGSIKIFQDMTLWRWVLKEEQAKYEIKSNRKVWIQVVKGTIEMNGHRLRKSDGVAVSGEKELTFGAEEDEAEILLFDLPS